MKKIICTIVMALSMIVAPVVSHAEGEGVYVEPKIGFDVVKNTWDGGHTKTWNLGVSTGVNLKSKFEVPVRVELEYMYMMAHKVAVAPKVYNHTNAVMANVAYDFDCVPYVTPYLTAGLGIAWHQNGGNHPAFAANVGGGVLYPINERWAVDGQIRYLYLGKNEVNGLRPRESGVNFTVGVRYTF